MTGDAQFWATIGNIANTAGATTVIIGGAKAYQTYASPDTSLTKSKRKLKRVRSKLQQLSPQRREQIEIATRSMPSDCKGLKDLENQLEIVTDLYSRLSKRYDEATFTECHFPYSRFRYRVSELEESARQLLNDTLKTTVPFVDDIEVNPEKLTQAGAAVERSFISSSESLDAPSTPSASCSDNGDIPMSRV